MPLFGLFHRNKDGVETPIEVIPDDGADATHAAAPATAKAAPADPALSAEIASLRDQLSQANARETQAREQFEAKAKADRIAGIKSAAASFAAKAVTDSKILPAAKDGLETLHAFVGLAAAGLPTDGIDAVAGLAAMVEGLPSHSLTTEAVPAGGKLPDGLQTLSRNTGDETITEAKQVALLDGYEAGPAAIAILKGKK